MSNDVGRNDPCPCGSGAKYKYCCLRKRKPRSPGWQSQLADAVKQGSKLDRDGKQTEAVDRWLSGWQKVRNQIPSNITTLAELNDELDDAPHLGDWFWRFLDNLRHPADDEPSYAQRGAEFTADILEKLTDESAQNRLNIRADHGYLLALADRWDDAESVFEQIVDDHPKSAAGYAVWADAILDTDAYPVSKALQLLERARDESVDDPEHWSLDDRIEYVEQLVDSQTGDADETEESQSDDEEEMMERWEAFWQDFEDTEVDEQFRMAEECIENEPDFDGEWAFQLMIDWLMGAARDERRGDQWLDTLDLIRQRHPDVAREESGVLGKQAVRFALVDAPDRLGSALDYLFEDPGENLDYIFQTRDILGYHGVTQVYDHLLNLWDNHRSQLMAPGKLVDWLARVWLARRAEDDIEQSPAFEQFEDELGALDEFDIRPEVFEATFDNFLGSASHGLRLDDSGELAEAHLDAVAFRFGRELVDNHRWSKMKALFASSFLAVFFSEQADVDDPFQTPLCTRKATDSPLLKKELKQLREPWIDQPAVVPHPDLALGYVERLLTTTMFGRPFAAATFYEAVVRLAPWLQKREVLTDEGIVDQIQRHFARRIQEVTSKLLDSSRDALMDENLRRVGEYLQPWA